MLRIKKKLLIVNAIVFYYPYTLKWVIPESCPSTILPAKSDSNVVFCLQLLSKTLTFTINLG